MFWRSHLSIHLLCDDFKYTKEFIMTSTLYHLKINLFKCSIQAWFCSITLLLRRSVELNCKSTGNINQYLNYILHVYYGCKFLKFTFYENSEYLQFLKDKIVCSNLQSNVVTIHKNSDPLELCLQINFLRRQLKGILLYTQARTSLLRTFFLFKIRQLHILFTLFLSFFTKCLYKLVWLQNCNLHPMQMYEKHLNEGQFKSAETSTTSFNLEINVILD